MSDQKTEAPNRFSSFLKTLEIETAALQRTWKVYSSDPRAQRQADLALTWMKNTLDAGGKLIVTGLGKSGKIAQKVAATLTSTGSLAIYLHPTEGLHGDLGILQANDCVLAFSQTGNTEELLKLLPGIKARGVKLIAIAGKADSQLVNQCDAWLDSSVEQEACPLNLAPTASTTTALALGDALAVTLMTERGFRAEDFAQSHPGGALGKRLHLQVSDLMIPLARAPQLQASASITEVIAASTQGGAGAVLVLSDSGTLEGIITDGDIRRALGQPDRFFSLSAADLMTRNPITIQNGDSAWAALRLMEDRPSQISVLPVMDHGRPCGLLRLHDLVRHL